MKITASFETIRPTLLVVAMLSAACSSQAGHGTEQNASQPADAAGGVAIIADAGVDAGATTVEVAVPNDGVPCPVSQALAANCQKCHSATPMFGAPMPLVTYADLQKPSVSDPSLNVAQAAQKRIEDKVSPMPPGGNIGDGDRTTLLDWLSAGAPQAPEAERTCAIAKPTRSEDYWKAGLSAAPGETCYDFPNHQGQTLGDATAYGVKPGEHYEQFYFKVPWGADMVATKFGTKFDNLKVVHHWLLFTTSKPGSADGSHETSIGTTIGDSSTLLAGWAVGGDNLIFDDDMGLELPPSGMLNAQWHFNNQGSDTEQDASALQVCVVPRTMRQNIAGVTFLGTENFNGFSGMPAHTVSKYGGSCVNKSKGPITIWGLTPHMHRLGRHMTTSIKRLDGSMETVFDKDFDFNSQITYPLKPALVLQVGESIQSTCTFDNTTSAAVPFGPSTTQEMCYNFTMSYPAKALDNHVFSLIGALDTCW
jgi:hypothetical protein